MAVTWLYIVLLSLIIVPLAASCPSYCQCDSLTQSVICRSHGLTAVPTDLPPDTISLDLQNNLIANIDISSYPDMRSLDLTGNRVVRITNDTFNDSVSLQRLILGSNRLIEIDYLPDSLLELDVSHNKLKTIHVSDNFVTLNASYNQIVNVTTSAASLLKYFDLSFNKISFIHAFAFQNLSKLVTMKLNHLPDLYHINHTAFSGLTDLKELELSNNPRFYFIHKDLFKDNINLRNLTLSNNNITSFYRVAYEHLNNLTLDIHNNPLLCNCALKWLRNNDVTISRQTETRCSRPEQHRSEVLFNIPPDDLTCIAPRIVNYTREAYFKIGTQAVLKCLVEGDPEPMVKWVIPSGKTFTYNNYLEDQWDNRPSKELILDQIYHKNGAWQKVAHKYQDDDELGPDRILLLSNGDLFISYVNRRDAGPYKCVALSPGGNETETMKFLLNYTIIKDITVASMIVGFSSAGIFFGFGLLVGLIRYIGNKCAERQRKKSRSIKKLIGHLDNYRTQQIDKLKENYGGHVGKMKEHALTQMDKMRDNYFSQIARIQEKCASRMDHLRENYNTQMSKIKGYSNHQIEKIRENYNSQMIKIRDYGSIQLEKLRETYKLQHQHLMKILEAMNIDNCRSIVDDDALKVSTALFETKFSLDTIGGLDLDAMPPLELDTLTVDNISMSRNSLISEDFLTASSDPEGLSLSQLEVHARVHGTEDGESVHGLLDESVQCPDIDGSQSSDVPQEVVVLETPAVVHGTRPHLHSAATQTQEEELTPEAVIIDLNPEPLTTTTI